MMATLTTEMMTIIITVTVVFVAASENGVCGVDDDDNHEKFDGDCGVRGDCGSTYGVGC